MEKEIDPAGWPRRAHYELFRAAAMPHMSLTARVDVTAFHAAVKAENGSLFAGVLYAALKAANDIPEMRIRFRDRRIIEHERIHASYTVPLSGDRFGFCETLYSQDRKSFEAAMREAIATATAIDELTENTTESDHWIYSSCMPWLDFTGAQQPVASADDCIPRIVWGKIVERDGRREMAVNLQAHHALVDGLHAARFFELMQRNLDGF
ncbi:MAG: chloramphenicol acetyltransferase [Alphaproteobacteria bacterium]|nr:MAG: chloramphenicol acetyltransferase [Alphaproteobacteria bacterium]